MFVSFFTKLKPWWAFPRPLAISFALGGTAWIIASWLIVYEFVLPLLFTGLINLGVPLVAFVQEKNMVAILFLSFIYAPLTVALVWLFFKPYLRRKGQSLKALVGLARWPQIKDSLFGVGAYVVYMALALASFVLVSYFLPHVNLNQAQDLGINRPADVLGYILTFVMLVILPPFVEEVLFRGFLFGTLRRGFPWWLSALLTSLLFGLAHQQVNLFIDTFILSLVLCYLREKTGSIWAGMLVHSLKNTLAFLYFISLIH